MKALFLGATTPRLHEFARQIDPLRQGYSGDAEFKKSVRLASLDATQSQCHCHHDDSVRYQEVVFFKCTRLVTAILD